MKLLKQTNRQIERFSGPLIAMALLMITMTLTINVVGRYVFSVGLSWAEELSTYTIIWITMVGSGICVKRKLHVSVDLVHIVLGGAILRWLTICIDTVAFGFSLLLVYYGAQLALFAAEQLSPALLVPMYIPYGALVVGGLFTALEYLEDILNTVLADN